ncbi:MAG TPA: ribonuclease III domain-containing protein, partial [Draconibacterium sp.]|nr:ribonuclease III domain-containing protein [Draconibacterium sp.]
MVRRIVQRIKLFSSGRKEFYLFLKNLIGFYPQNLKLYDLAFLHKSASTIDSRGNFVNNERLEFLGDAILSAVIADFLYNRFPHEDEGFLTKTRSKLVNRTFLTKLTYDMGLDVFIDSNTTKNIDNSHIYGDALEALIGAIYLDKD